MTSVSASDNPVLTVDPDGVGWITFDAPDRTHNVLEESVMTALDQRLEQARAAAERDELHTLVFISGKPAGFIAGADIDAIAGITDPDDAERKARMGQELFQRIAELPFVTIAAIHGICVGGGLELALACRYRIGSAHPDTRLGLPEVQLGILPGWGGTTRLPRLVGLQASLDLLLSGNPVRAEKARRIGLLDEVVPAAGFRAQVQTYARARHELAPPMPRVARLLRQRLADDTLPGQTLVLRAARRMVLKKTDGHYPAPLAILDVLRRALRRPVPEALQIEAQAFARLTSSPVHGNLLHVFRLREDARRTRVHVPDAEPAEVRRMGVLGAGVMGGGIAQVAASRAIEVRIKDIRDEAITGALQHARGLFDRDVKRHRLSRREAARAMERISGRLDWNGFASADLVVEAVVERMDVKTSVLRECEAAVSGDCIIATNTSSLSVEEMADALAQPERFAGLHFFNPVHRMPLVEIIRGRRTSEETIATLHALTVQLGKVPVVCGDGAGFVVNRILGPYLNEAGHLLADGSPVHEIDGAALKFGMPMGPLRLMDEVGLDIARHAGASLHRAFGERLAPAAPLLALEASERLGRKNGRGFYTYEGGQGREEIDESVYAELGDTIPTRSEGSGPSLRDIRSRLVLCMVNEAARVLDEGIVGEAGAVDLAMIMGTGFPPFRGGLLRFADTLHPRGLVERLEQLRDEVGERFEPAPLIRRLAESDQTFYQAFGSDLGRR